MTQDEMCIDHTVPVVGLSLSVGLVEAPAVGLVEASAVGLVEASAVGLAVGTRALRVDSEVTTTRDMGAVLQITGIRTYTT